MSLMEALRRVPVCISAQLDVTVLGGRRWRPAVPGWGEVRLTVPVACAGGCRCPVVGTLIATRFSSKDHVTGMAYSSVSLGSSATTVFLFAYKTESAMTFRRTCRMVLACKSLVTICYPTEGAVAVVQTCTHESHALTILAIGHAHMPSLSRPRTRNFDDDTRGAGGIDGYKA